MVFRHGDFTDWLVLWAVNRSVDRFIFLLIIEEMGAVLGLWIRFRHSVCSILSKNRRRSWTGILWIKAERL